MKLEKDIENLINASSEAKRYVILNSMGNGYRNPLVIFFKNLESVLGSLLVNVKEHEL